jgi:uncharacterized membrane protein
MRLTKFLALLVPLALLAVYYLGVQWLVLKVPRHPLTVAFVLGPALLGVALALWHAKRRVLALLVPAAAAGVLSWRFVWRGPPDVSMFYMVEYVSVYGAVAWLFWRSHQRGTPLITQLARSVHPLTPEMERYTAKTTRVWALYLAGMGLLALLLFALLPFRWWVWYINIISPLALVVFFVGEYVLRYRWHPEFERTSLWVNVRAWRQRGVIEQQGLVKE